MKLIANIIELIICVNSETNEKPHQTGIEVHVIDGAQCVDDETGNKTQFGALIPR